MARPDRYATKARREARINGRTQRGRDRELSSGMRELLEGLLPEDFTPADLLRYGEQLRKEKRNLETAGFSPETQALLYHHMFGMELMVKRIHQENEELRRLQKNCIICM